MTSVVTTSNAADFLAVVPHLVGFQPLESIVFVAFRGTRTCGAMRFDLPQSRPTDRETVDDGPADDAGSTLHKRVATTLVGMLSKLPGVDAVLPVVYTSESFGGVGDASPAVVGRGGVPHSAFVRSVVDRFEFSGFRVRDALCVASDGWGSYFDGALPAGGRRLAEIAASRVLDDLPSWRRDPLGAVAELASLPEVAPRESAATARHLERLAAVIDGSAMVDGIASIDDLRSDDVRTGDLLAGDLQAGDPASPDPASPDAESTVNRLARIPRTLEAILSREPAGIEPLEAAFVAALARLPAMRDVVMLQWAFDAATGASVLRDARRYALGVPAGELGSAGLMLGDGPRPDPARVERAIEALKRVTSLTPPPHRPPLFCMLAWLEWALGRSSVAHAFVVAAEQIDPHYGLAELMRAVLERGMLPEWAFVGDR